MSEIICDDFNLILEKCGIWNYPRNTYSTTKDFNADVVENLYLYVRQEIIKYLNNNEVDFVIEIPKRLIKIPLKNQYLNLKTIEYSNNYTNANIVPMLTVYNYKNKETKIIIKSNIADTSFKTNFFHEMRHVFQKTFEQSTFTNQNVSSIQNISNNFDLLKLFIYKLNPNEYTAYKEQIYNKSFDLAYSGKNIQYIKSNMLKYMLIDEKTYSLIVKLLNSNDDKINKYILYIFLWNTNEIINSSKNYRLFSSELYKDEYIINIRNQIKKIIIENNHLKLNNYINKAIDGILNNKQDLFQKIKTTFLKRIDLYRERYLKDIDKIIYIAFDDAVCARKNHGSERELNNNGLFNYILLDDKENYYIELSVYDLQHKCSKYTMIKSDTIYNVFVKILILQHILNKKAIANFIYKSLSISFKEFIDNTLTKNNVTFDNIEDLLLLQYNDMSDLESIIKKLNDFNF